MNKGQQGTWIAAAMFATGLSVVSASAGEVRIWPTATATGDAVLLGQVAELRGFDMESERRLAQVGVFDAPTPGGELLVRADDIRSALADAGEDLSAIQLIGAARCKVSKPRPPRVPRPAPHLTRSIKKIEPRPTPAKPVARPTPPEKKSPSGTMESALRDYIQASFPEPDAKLEIRFSPAKADDLRSSDPDAKYEIRSRDEKKLGLRSFEVSVVRQGEIDRRIPIVGEVTLLKEVVVARRAINRGETIEGRALKLEERRFTDLAAVGLTDLSAATGQQSRGFVRPGEMINEQSVEQRPVVARGQPVTIWMRQGSLAIRTTGRAQQSGGLGDRIEVLRDGARRKQDLIEAMVTGPGTVSMGSPEQLAAGSSGWSAR
ncbi:MAG TPA: flagellar basal body P-ring formation chaperone FlgA [Phycisphaerae bacterium]|nr:flagellar basal body P-ring formation chaperone FlgA [Phycisphaerae bacterium]